MAAAWLVMLPTASDAQNWFWAKQFGGPGNESLVAMAPGSAGQIYATGSFTGSLELDGQRLNSAGREDAFLLQLGTNGSVDWALQAGGIRQEEPVDVAVGPQGEIYWVGNFYESVQIGSLTLRAPTASKSVFLSKITPGGVVSWARVLGGTGLKNAGDIAIGANGGIFLTGNFADTLMVGDSIFRAVSDGDFYLARFEADGTLAWMTTAGVSGTTRGRCVAVLPGGELVAAGHFEGVVAIGADTLRTNTPDQDLFVARFSAGGQPSWARRAGGVYDAISTGMALSDAGHILLTGYHRGVIRLNDSLSIQPKGFNDDCFLLAYDADGHARWARSFGSAANDLAGAIATCGSRTYVTGSYAGAISLDGRELALTGGGLSNAFVAEFDSAGVLTAISGMGGGNFVLGRSVICGSGGEIWAGGVFSDSVRLDAGIWQSAGFYDFYIGQLKPGFTGTRGVPSQLLDVVVYPNPTTGLVFVQPPMAWLSAAVFDHSGRLLKQLRNSGWLDFSDLPPGVYYLLLHTRQGAAGMVKVVRG
jgi:hypothetical protein